VVGKGHEQGPDYDGAMNRFMRRAIFGVALVGVAVAAWPVQADAPVQSHWRTDEVRIDGVMSDWPGLTFVSKEVATSVVNDGQDLYVLVASSDPGVILQVTRAGLAVFLDAKGGKAETFGVRIPPLGSRLAPGNAPAGAQDDQPVLSYFDILGPGRDDMRRVEVDETTGVDLRIGTNDGTLFMEVKVPLVAGAGRPYAPGINLAKGEVGFGIVTPDPPREVRAGRGGRGGGFVMGGSGGGARMPGAPKGKDVNVWTRIVLAKGR